MKTMKSNPISSNRILYDDLINMIDGYIDGVGLTKATADILTMLCNRLYDKLRIIGPMLEKEEKEENESHVP